MSQTEPDRARLSQTEPDQARPSDLGRFPAIGGASQAWFRLEPHWQSAAAGEDTRSHEMSQTEPDRFQAWVDTAAVARHQWRMLAFAAASRRVRPVPPQCHTPNRTGRTTVAGFRSFVFVVLEVPEIEQFAQRSSRAGSKRAESAPTTSQRARCSTTATAATAATESGGAHFTMSGSRQFHTRGCGSRASPRARRASARCRPRATRPIAAIVPSRGR
eukprot:scaffold79442_cov66-Phaeocystis_antarctica.AAC.4